MRLIELSLHILDLIENSINAGADEIHISLIVDEDKDLLTLIIEDNGKGFSVDEELLFDPFYTTKTHKVVGMGLSLSKSSAERAGGSISLGKSENLGGAKVVLTFVLSHIDRVPVGDLGNTIAGIFLTNPNIEIKLEIIRNSQTELKISTMEYRRRYNQKNEIEIYQIMEQEINSVIKRLEI